MENNDVEEVEIFAHTDDFLIMQICAVLEDNNIEYFKINEGVGEYISLVFGKSHEMKRIIVSKENEEKARELLNNFIECEKN